MATKIEGQAGTAELTNREAILLRLLSHGRDGDKHRLGAFHSELRVVTAPDLEQRGLVGMTSRSVWITKAGREALAATKGGDA